MLEVEKGIAYIFVSGAHKIFLFLRYKYMTKNPTTAPKKIPAVVSQKANYRAT